MSNLSTAEEGANSVGVVSADGGGEVVYQTDFSAGMGDVRGFSGAGQISVALVRDEVDGRAAVRLGVIRHLIRNGEQLVVNSGICCNGLKGAETNDGSAAMAFAPATDYLVEFELRGSVPVVFLNFKSFPDKPAVPEDYWQGQTNVGMEPNAIHPDKEWKTYTARFRTRADTIRGGIALQLWSSSKDEKYACKPGDYLLLRRITIRKRPAVDKRINLEADE